MAVGKVYERRWPARLEAFTADGTINGQVTVGDSCGFFVKMKVNITATGLPTLRLEIKRVESNNIIFVGPTTNELKESVRRVQAQSIDARTDITAYTTALAGQISAAEQMRPNILENYIFRAVFQEEPAVALRVMQVDKLGNPVGGGGGVSSNVNIHDASGTGITSTAVGPDQGLDVNIISSLLPVCDIINSWTESLVSVGTTEVQITPIANQKTIRLVPLTCGTYYYGFATGVDTTFESFNKRSPVEINTNQDVFVIKSTGAAADVRVYQGATP